MRSVELAGATLVECGLCGEQFGDRRAVNDQALGDEATARGVDRIVWPLAKALGGMPGFRLDSASPGSGESPPFVDLVVTGPEALVQLENVAKALRLAEGSLRCSWQSEARFDHALVMRIGPATVAGKLRDAQLDIEVFAQHIERDMRLNWWRCANGSENG